MRRVVGVLLSCVLVGCGASPPPPPTTPTNPEEPVTTKPGPPPVATGPAVAGPEPGQKPPGPSEPKPVPTAANGAGTDKSQPVFTCGAGESYEFIASKFQCPEGGNPFAGSIGLARRSRRGNVGPHMRGDPADILNSHIVDLYSVPCQAGPVEVYVCMYHCPPGRSPLN